jgi:hypothetical protein
MSQAPFSVIFHVSIVGPYLHISVWHVIKGDVNFFRLGPHEATMVPYPSKPHAPLQRLQESNKKALGGSKLDMYATQVALR